MPRRSVGQDVQRQPQGRARKQCVVNWPLQYEKNMFSTSQGQVGGQPGLRRETEQYSLR